jgi:hypothetical protein
MATLSNWGYQHWGSSVIKYWRDFRFDEKPLQQVTPAVETMILFMLNYFGPKFPDLRTLLYDENHRMQ